MTPKLIELQPNRLLLDTEFEGYKLSLEAIPVLKQEFGTSVDRALPSTDQYSFLHAKLYGLHNHLIGETVNEIDLVYYIDKLWHIKKLSLAAFEDGWNLPENVWEIRKNREQTPGDYNISLKLPSEDLAVLGDGMGRLDILETGCRLDNLSWNSVFSEEILGVEKCFMVQDVVLMTNKHCKKELHCLLLNISQKCSGHSSNELHWITLTQNGDKTWELTALREIQGEGGVYYAYLEPTCEALYIASDNGLKFTVDSENAVVQNADPEQIVQQKYTWNQDKHTVNLNVKLPNNFVENDLDVRTTTSEISFKYKEVELLIGKLYRQIEPSLTAWSVLNDMLEVTLHKTDNLTWSRVFHVSEKEDQLDDNLVEQIHERLTHLCRNAEVAPSTGTTFNTEQTEECDYEEDKRIVFERLSVSSHEVTHRASISSHKILLAVKLSDYPPAIALRHDVDACIWQPCGTGETWTLKHEGTLNAFAYVQCTVSLQDAAEAFRIYAPRFPQRNHPAPGRFVSPVLQAHEKGQLQENRNRINNAAAEIRQQGAIVLACTSSWASKQQRKFSVCSPNLGYCVICETSRHIFIYRQQKAVTSGELRQRITGRKVGTIAQQQVVNLTDQEILGIYPSIRNLFLLTNNCIYVLKLE